MNVILELTEDDLKKLYAEKKISVNTELVYKKNKINDMELFLKVIDEDKKKGNKFCIFLNFGV